MLAGSACQIVTMTGFLLTQDEAGLFVVAATFGLGFSGIIPAYVLALRELYPESEASWRVPSLLLCSGSGMAAGGWLAVAIYDYAGFYAVAAGIIAKPRQFGHHWRAGFPAKPLLRHRARPLMRAWIWRLVKEGRTLRTQPARSRAAVYRAGCMAEFWVKPGFSLIDLAWAHRLPTWFPAGSPLVDADTPAASGHRRGGLCRFGVVARALLVPARVVLARWRCQTR